MKRIGVAALLLLAACGDDDNGGPATQHEDGEAAREDAVQKCTDLVDNFCDRVTKCAVDADILDDSYPASELRMDCENAIDNEEELDCARADRIGKSYDQCLSDVKKVSCDDSNASLLDDMLFTSPPASCNRVILFEQ